MTSVLPLASDSGKWAWNVIQQGNTGSEEALSLIMTETHVIDRPPARSCIAFCSICCRSANIVGFKLLPLSYQLLMSRVMNSKSASNEMYKTVQGKCYCYTLIIKNYQQMFWFIESLYWLMLWADSCDYLMIRSRLRVDFKYWKLK